MGAQTPEELDRLLEDAIVVRDGAAVRGLFELGGILAVGDAELRGDAIAAWPGSGYVAAPRRVLQTRGTALLVSDMGVGVLRRDPDAGWRFAIALLNPINKETR